MSLKTHNGQESLLSSAPPPIPLTTVARNWHSGVVCCFQWNVTFSSVALFSGLNLRFCRSERDDDVQENGCDVDRR